MSGSFYSSLLTDATYVGKSGSKQTLGPHVGEGVAVRVLVAHVLAGVDSAGRLRVPR